MLLKLRLQTILFRRSYSKLSYIHNVGSQPLLSITIGQLVQQAADAYPNRPAIISCHQNKQLTFADLLTTVDKVATGLKKLGINRGDSLAIWGPNSAEWIITSLACARIGAIVVQLNHSYKKNELLYSINKTKAKALVCGNSTSRQHYYDIIKEVDKGIFNNGTRIRSEMMPSLQTIVTMDENRSGARHIETLSTNHSNADIQWIKDNQHSIQFDDPANIQLSSGSTGQPKAVLLSHHNVVNNSYNYGHRMELHKKHHKICCQVPLFHTYGSTAGIYASLHFGATLVLPSAFYNPLKGLQAIKEHSCTIIYGTPTMHVDLIEQQKEHNLEIRPEVACSGGAPATPQLIQNVYKYLRCHSVVNIFGMTETTALCFQSHLNQDIDHVANTVGHITNHIEAKVVDEKGNLVPFGSPGEFCARGYMNMLGYLDDPEKTAEVMGSDRWLKSGDKFIMYEDGTGKVIGRIKEIINRGGENIYPKEIEDYLTTHPKLVDCQVVGIPHERLGEEVCACIRLKLGQKITLKEVVDFCNEQIAHYKIPSKIHVVDEYPKTTSGKIQKFKLVELLKKEYNL